MDSSKILITGANGQLGLALQQKYSGARALDHIELDITAPDALNKVDWQGMQIIINAAGYTNVDGAETPEGRIAAWQVNAAGVENLTKLAIEKDLTIVHISTEYVFDGTKSLHAEDEPLSPLSSYGASKAAGDAILALAPKHYLLRTSWLIGEGKNFVRTMLELGKKGVSPSVVADQVGRPTFTSELVRAIDHLLSKRCPFGTYNLSSDGDLVSWADLAREIFKTAGFSSQVTDTTTEQYFASKQNVAKRPLNSSLDLAKIKAIGFSPDDWRRDLEEYVKKELSK